MNGCHWCALQASISTTDSSCGVAGGHLHAVGASSRMRAAAALAAALLLACLAGAAVSQQVCLREWLLYHHISLLPLVQYLLLCTTQTQTWTTLAAAK